MNVTISTNDISFDDIINFLLSIKSRAEVNEVIDRFANRLSVIKIQVDDREIGCHSFTKIGEALANINIKYENRELNPLPKSQDSQSYHREADSGTEQ